MAVGAIAPGPAAAVVQNSKFVAHIELNDLIGVVGWLRQKRCCGNKVAEQRLGIVGGDYPAGEADIGQVLAVGVGRRIGRVGDAGQREAVNGRRGRVPWFSVPLVRAGRRLPRH